MYADDAPDFPGVLSHVIRGAALSEDQAKWLMNAMMTGALHDAQIGGILVALSKKGVAGEELADLARALTSHSVRLELNEPNLVDTCGTGGGSPTFNISTGAAFVAAAAGAKIAKHGNRGMTSGCGSADVLEALGIAFTGDVDTLTRRFGTLGLVFLFAPHHHPAMRHVGPSRKALGIRTVFNLLGPLANPAGAQYQVIGVFAREMVEPVGRALALLGCRRGFVVHGEDGLDEVSPCAPTAFVRAENGEVFEGVLNVSDFGLEPLPASAIRGGASADENAQILVEALSKPDSKRALALVPTAGLALWLGGKADTLKEGAALALETISSGAALEMLNRARAPLP